MDPELELQLTARRLARVLRAHATQLEADATRLEVEVASARAFSLASIRSINDTDAIKVATEVVRRLRDGDLRGIFSGEAKIKQLRAEAARVRLAAANLVPGKLYTVKYKDLPYLS